MGKSDKYNGMVEIDEDDPRCAEIVAWFDEMEHAFDSNTQNFATSKPPAKIAERKKSIQGKTGQCKINKHPKPNVNGEGFREKIHRRMKNHGGAQVPKCKPQNRMVDRFGPGAPKSKVETGIADHCGAPKYKPENRKADGYGVPDKFKKYSDKPEKRSRRAERDMDQL